MAPKLNLIHSAKPTPPGDIIFPGAWPKQKRQPLLSTCLKHSSQRVEKAAKTQRESLSSHNLKDLKPTSKVATAFIYMAGMDSLPGSPFKKESASALEPWPHSPQAAPVTGTWAWPLLPNLGLPDGQSLLQSGPLVWPRLGHIFTAA